MTKKERNLKKILELKDFQPKFHKNIIIDFAHAQSTVAKTESCYICGLGVSKKELKKMTGRDYGYTFGQFRNKRHMTHPKHNKSWNDYNYFTSHICSSCVGEIEKSLDKQFKKSYAP